MRIGTVAILGGGIMGCSIALEFARHGVRCVIFELMDNILSGASRWNEGKIHLGYIYSADPSMVTARKVLPGALSFRPLIERHIGTSIADAITPTDDLFLCHDRSIVTPGAMADYFHKVDELVREHPAAQHYLADARSVATSVIRPDGLGSISLKAGIRAGFAVPERSVNTNWIADRLTEVVRENPAIELRTGTRVLGVSDEIGGRCEVLTEAGREGPFDCVINALWQGRLAIDAKVGLTPPREWSHRYRVSMFMRSRAPAALPSALIAVGPFGDLKNYNGRDFYLSWYPAGLLSESRNLIPPEVRHPDRAEAAEIASSIFGNLATFIPAVRELSHDVERMEIRGGWVYAAASGSLSDPRATLHQRTDFGITRKGRYISVDTGKYSSAPLLANKLVSEFVGSD